MILTAAIAMAFNLLIILIKIKRGLVVNATIDTVLLIFVIIITAGSVTGTQEGMIASAILSIYLMISPFPEWYEIEDKFKTNNK